MTEPARCNIIVLLSLDQERLHAFVTSCLDYCHSRTLQGRRSVRGHLISTCSPALSASHVKNRELKSSTRRFNPYFLKPHQTLEGICMQRSSQGGRTDGRAPSLERLLVSTETKTVPPPSILNARCFGNKGKSMCECQFILEFTPHFLELLNGEHALDLSV